MKDDKRINSGKYRDDNEESILQKIPFRIIEVSSEEQNYPASELLNHTPFSRGWQSSRFSNYPQEIVLEFPNSVRIKQIQILSHQYKITSKIEIFIDNTKEDSMKKFKKIGHLSLESNQKTNYQARELKSVFIDNLAQKLKFALHICHTNPHNIHSQVGLIAINILGEYLDSSGDNVNQNLKKNESPKLEDEMNYDPATLNRLKQLYKAKDRAVDVEDFDEAKRIKLAIDNLKSVSSQLIQLEERKRIAIRNDDFDSAKMIKYEIERLRNAVSGMQLNQLKKQADVYSSNIKHSNNNEDPDRFDNHIPITKNKKFEEIPITTDLVLERDENVIKTKKMNPNDGYKLQGRDEKKLNVDEMEIKGISRDFKDLLNDKLKKAGVDPDENEHDDVEDISASDYKRAEPLMPVLTNDIVKLLFSKQWKHKEEGIKIIKQNLESYPKSELFSQVGPDKIITAVLGASAFVLNVTVSQPLSVTMDTLKILLNKFRGNNVQGHLRQELDDYVDQSMLLLIEKVGDTNIKLKEKAENTIIEFANSPLIGYKTVFEDLLTGQVKKTLTKSARHISGRLNVMNRMIANFGLNNAEVPIEKLMTYAINSYKDPNKEVRDAAYNLIMGVYKYIGEDVRNYYKDLRQAQINMLEEGFENVDGFDNNNNAEPEEEFVNKSQLVYNNNTNQDQKGDGKQTIKNEKKDIVNDNVNPVDETTTCRFCHFFDPNLDEDGLFMHFFKECPMLTSCYKCKQTIEIAELNYHYVNECNFKNEFKTCSICKEAIDVQEYNQHVAEKSCIQAKSPNVCNRCPLCHTDFTPSGRLGWNVHLLENTCPNNPRTNY